MSVARISPLRSTRSGRLVAIAAFGSTPASPAAGVEMPNMTRRPMTTRIGERESRRRRARMRPRIWSRRLRADGAAAARGASTAEWHGRRARSRSSAAAPPIGSRSARRRSRALVDRRDRIGADRLQRNLVDGRDLVGRERLRAGSGRRISSTTRLQPARLGEHAPLGLEQRDAPPSPWRCSAGAARPRSAATSALCFMS